jgi:hypothetical protein
LSNITSKTRCSNVRCAHPALADFASLIWICRRRAGVGVLELQVRLVDLLSHDAGLFCDLNDGERRCEWRLLPSGNDL